MTAEPTMIGQSIYDLTDAQASNHLAIHSSTSFGKLHLFCVLYVGVLATKELGLVVVGGVANTQLSLSWPMRRALWHRWAVLCDQCDRPNVVSQVQVKEHQMLPGASSSTNTDTTREYDADSSSADEERSSKNATVDTQ